MYKPLAIHRFVALEKELELRMWVLKTPFFVLDCYIEMRNLDLIYNTRNAGWWGEQNEMAETMILVFAKTSGLLKVNF